MVIASVISSLDTIFTDVFDTIFKSSPAVSPKAKISIPPCVALIVIASVISSFDIIFTDVFDTIFKSFPAV